MTWALMTRRQGVGTWRPREMTLRSTLEKGSCSHGDVGSPSAA